MHLNFAYLPVLVVFGMGIVAGMVSVIKVVRTGLETYRSQTIYLIIGLMLGSLYSIVMGPTTLDVPQAAMTFNTFDPGFFILGGLFLFGLQKMKKICPAKEACLD